MREIREVGESKRRLGKKTKVGKEEDKPLVRAQSVGVAFAADGAACLP